MESRKCVACNNVWSQTVGIHSLFYRTMILWYRNLEVIYRTITIMYTGSPPTPVNCRFTTYGCCPGDSMIAARGPNAAGCPGKRTRDGPIYRNYRDISVISMSHRCKNWYLPITKTHRVQFVHLYNTITFIFVHLQGFAILEFSFGFCLL